MAGVSPKPAIHDLALVLRVSLETRELPIAKPFEHYAGRPQAKSEKREAAYRRQAAGFQDPILRGARNKKQQDRLAQEYLCQRG